MLTSRMIASLIVLSFAGAAQPQATHSNLLALELREHCSTYLQDPGSTEGALCSTYVQGFLQGAASIDDRVRPAKPIVAESWTDRAHRTRLGPDRLRAPAYCVDEDEPLHRIISRIVAHGSNRSLDAPLLAGDYVAQALRRLYPC